MDSSTQDSELLEFNPMDLFCNSIDTLRGSEIDQTVPPDSGWPSRSARVSGDAGGAAAGGGRIVAMMSSLSAIESSHGVCDHEGMRSMCRRGIPPSMRRAAWIINSVSAANPNMSKSDCDDFGTFRNARVIGKNAKLIDAEIHCQQNQTLFLNSSRRQYKRNIEHGWDLTLKSLFPDQSDLERAEVLDFGVGHDNLMNILYQGGSPIPDKGIRALTKVLHAVRESLGLEFCPLLPDLTCFLLSYMPVSSFCFFGFCVGVHKQHLRNMPRLMFC
jgi:hypothetical protein